jgi:hypothetical protein
LSSCRTNSRFTTLLAYEGFNYATGASLVGQGGGFGFAGAWGSTGGATVIQVPTLGYGDLATSGGRLYTTGDTTGSVAIFRDLSFSRGDEGTTTWISFLGQNTTTPSANFGPDGSPSRVRGWNLSLFQDGSEKLALGEGTRTSGVSLPDTDVWGFVDRGGANNAATVWSTEPIELLTFVVVRIDHGAENVDVAYMWLNPSLDSEPSLASADISTTGDWGFNRIRPFAGNPNATSADVPSEGYFDEIRIGTTWDAVVVPEPTLLALLGLGAVGAVWRMRRRA